jgi:hypothetical protein
LMGNGIWSDTYDDPKVIADPFTAEHRNSFQASCERYSSHGLSVPEGFKLDIYIIIIIAPLKGHEKRSLFKGAYFPQKWDLLPPF